MNELPTHHDGVCPYCGSAISCVTRDGTTYARCSHRGCGARGPIMRSLDRAVEMFKRTVRTHAAGVDAPCVVCHETDGQHRMSCDQRDRDAREKAERGAVEAELRSPVGPAAHAIGGNESPRAPIDLAAEASERRGYVHATTTPGPRHARAGEPPQPDAGRCERCPVAETCKRCGRPVDNDAPLVERCIREGSFSCLQIEAAYHRGIARGVEIAKEHSIPHRFSCPPDAECAYDCPPWIDWTDVDREAAKLAGEVDRG